MSESIHTLITSAAIAERIEAMAGEIAPRIGPTPLIVALLKGSAVFCA
ncbi:MAG: hypoxanthine phosphoribosyltransferase, partial [Magnetococcales bacterium]|nr:hypoxanthine phosphoribosyltransferase [Magnetococcales bacterium]